MLLLTYATDADGSGELNEEEFAAVLARAADSEWKQVEDPSSGRVYFYHKKTKQTCWVQPGSGDKVSQFLATHIGERKDEGEDFEL